MNEALWHTSASTSELLAVETPATNGLAAVNSRFSMISTGTERLVALGQAAAPGQPLDAPYASGDYGFPIKYGYSLVGDDDSGRLVHCLHPHQDIAFVQARDLFQVPATVPPRRAALLSNMVTVLNAAWDADIEPGMDVLLCGFGNIGALLANTLRLQHALQPVVVETDAWRRDKARELGFEACAPGDLGTSFARVVHSTCTEAGLQYCIDRAAPDGIVVELSWYGTAPVTIELGGAFHRNRVTIRSSQVTTIPPAVRATVTQETRKQAAAELLTDESFDALITNEISFRDSPAFFAALRAGRHGDGLIWMIRY